MICEGKSHVVMKLLGLLEIFIISYCLTIYAGKKNDPKSNLQKMYSSPTYKK